MADRIDPKNLSIGFTNRDLCTRCGTCSAASPTGAIKPGPDFYPVIDPYQDFDAGPGKRTCPGAAVPYKRLWQLTFGPGVPYDPSFDGRRRLLYVGYAADERLRNGGAGGGVVTGLLWDLLKHGDVDGCLVTRMNPQKPWVGESFIARTLEDLLSSQGSKYAIVPHNQVLQQIRKLPGRFAYAGLPCQIHGLRLLLAEDEELAEKIRVIIGLFCGGALELDVVTDLLRTKGVKPEELSDFQFRGGDWPGKMRAVLKSGKIVDLHCSDYKDGAYNYFTYLYSPMRCLTCIDGSARFADIAVGDVWTRDPHGEYAFKAHSRILARTDRGVDVLENAIRRQTLIGRDVTADANYRTHRAQTKRKGSIAPIRIARLRKKGITVPVYDDELDLGSSFGERLVERLATAAHQLKHYPRVRYVIVWWLTSRWSLPLIWLRRLRKRWKYRTR